MQTLIKIIHVKSPKEMHVGLSLFKLIIIKNLVKPIIGNK